jgi:Arc/MetJ-type ribon-helix-helix transcriptional regulator
LRGRESGNTIRLTMKTLTVKIPEALETKLRSKAKAGKEPVSAVVRRALAREMEADAADFAKLAAPYVGMFSGPADLSTREGYGSRASR